ncbi:MAG: hypothetical protein M3R02_20110 [Chloroflexota bacterium]|nr:hypothetical protein [Chloroflexota bacterium]
MPAGNAEPPVQNDGRLRVTMADVVGLLAAEQAGTALPDGGEREGDSRRELYEERVNPNEALAQGQVAADQTRDEAHKETQYDRSRQSQSAGGESLGRHRDGDA